MPKFYVQDYCWTPFVSARARMTHQPQVRGWYAHRSFDLCKKSFTKFILLNYYYTGFILISPWPVAAAGTGDMYWSQSPAVCSDSSMSCWLIPCTHGGRVAVVCVKNKMHTLQSLHGCIVQTVIVACMCS